MKALRFHSRPARFLASGLGTASIAVGTLMLQADGAEAKVRAERMSYGICEMLQRDPVDPALLAQLRARADFPQILDFVERNCGGLIDPLIGPTATIAEPRDNRNGGNPVIRTPPAGGTPGDGGGPVDPVDPKDPEPDPAPTPAPDEKS